MHLNGARQPIRCARHQKEEMLVPGGGLEPPHCYQRRILNPLRLPIPPPGLKEPVANAAGRKRRIIAQAGGRLQGGGYNRGPCSLPISILTYPTN